MKFNAEQFRKNGAFGQKCNWDLEGIKDNIITLHGAVLSDELLGLSSMELKQVPCDGWNRQDFIATFEVVDDVPKSLSEYDQHLGFQIIGRLECGINAEDYTFGNATIRGCGIKIKYLDGYSFTAGG